MLNIRDLRIDPASLGCKMLLVDVMPAYEYKDGKRTETVTGYHYVVCLADNGKAKTSVEGTFKEFGVLPSAIQEKTPRMLAADSFCTTEQ